MLANLHLPRTLDALVHLVALSFTEPQPRSEIPEPAGSTAAAEDEAPTRPGHVLGDAVGAALYHATLAGARPWGC